MNLFGSLFGRVMAGVSLALLLTLGVQTWRASHWHGAYDKLHGEGVEVVTALVVGTIRTWR